MIATGAQSHAAFTEIAPVVDASHQKERDRMASNFEERGKALRATLEQTYQKLVAAHELRGGLHGTDVTDAVLPYVPIGISFGDAEAILRAAGFDVGPHPDINAPAKPNRPKDWYAVISKINPFISTFSAKVSIYISLLPKSPGDFTSVFEVQATFFVLGP